jgi:hypothetical protein
MINELQREILKNFFGGYFHQDWFYDAESTDAVVIEYVKDSKDEEVRALAEAIRNYSADFRSDAEIENKVYSEMGCYYVPSGDGLSAKMWLEGIASRLSGSWRR